MGMDDSRSIYSDLERERNLRIAIASQLTPNNKHYSLFTIHYSLLAASRSNDYLKSLLEFNDRAIFAKEIGGASE
jgi:hypothetical protein